MLVNLSNNNLHTQELNTKDNNAKTFLTLIRSLYYSHNTNYSYLI